MKKVMITTAALALAFGLSPHVGAQTIDNGSAAASDNSKAVVKTDNSTDNHTKTITKNDNDVKNITKTNTDSHNDGKAKASGAFGAAANNHSTATTSLQLSLTDAFNKSTVVNATKLDGYVSGNRISHIGNYGGDAYSYGNGARGGDGGYAVAKAHSGKAYSYGGDGGYANGGKGGSATGGAGSTSNGTNGGTANGGTGSPSNGGTNTGNTTNGATDWEAGNATGGAGGSGGTGGAGGAGGAATSGNATSTANGGNGGNGGRGGDAFGGSAGTFNASNTLSGLTGAAGVTVAMQNTGMASLQQIGVTTMANVTIGH
ncbi:MAG: hypothetical protein OJF50_006665 [Nitrospira sp.]|jgi:hypothetical protein|nr:hypothetical protein [Nitrospira sp.]